MRRTRRKEEDEEECEKDEEESILSTTCELDFGDPSRTASKAPALCRLWDFLFDFFV